MNAGEQVTWKTALRSAVFHQHWLLCVQHAMLLTRIETLLLLTVWAEGDMTGPDLRQRLLVTKGTTAPTITNLVELGLMETLRDDRDKRRLVHRITPKAERWIESLTASLQRRLDLAPAIKTTIAMDATMQLVRADAEELATSIIGVGRHHRGIESRW